MGSAHVVYHTAEGYIHGEDEQVEFANITCLGLLPWLLRTLVKLVALDTASVACNVQRSQRLCLVRLGGWRKSGESAQCKAWTFSTLAGFC